MMEPGERITLLQKEMALKPKEQPKPVVEVLPLKNDAEAVFPVIHEGTMAKPETLAESIKLPWWADSVRGTPNSILRSALFGATKPGKPIAFQKKKISSYGNTEIYYSGLRLDQCDLDIWQHCVELLKDDITKEIEFTSYEFLKAIGRSTGGREIEWLDSRLNKIGTAMVLIRDSSLKISYMGHLIEYGTRNEKTGRYKISLNPKMANLWGRNGWSSIEWQQRKELQGNYLALWLHGFYSSHKQPFALKAETLFESCGSEAAELWIFKQKLKAAMEKLSMVTRWKLEFDKCENITCIKPNKTLDPRV